MHVIGCHERADNLPVVRINKGMYIRGLVWDRIARILVAIFIKLIEAGKSGLGAPIHLVEKSYTALLSWLCVVIDCSVVTCVHS